MSKKIDIFIGNMGSGKSEISINYAFNQLKKTDRELKLLDLDIIKPYIRLRDVSDKIKKLGIGLLMPDESLRNADMPIVPSRMIEFLTDPNFDLVIDVGGEERGCITIAQFKEYFEKVNLSVHLVINPYRPFSDSQEKILHMMDSLQNNSKLTVTNLISNPHLRFDTTIDEIKKGTDLVIQTSEVSQVPVSFLCLWHKLLSDDFTKRYFDYKILPLRLFLTFPWENGLMEGL